MRTIAYRLVVLATVLSNVLAGTDPAASTNVTVVNDQVEPSQRLKSISLNLYVNQLELVPLPEDIEQAMLDNNICSFLHKSPFFKKEAEAKVSTVNPNNVGSTELLNRLRSIEDQNTEALVIAGKYAFVLSSTNWMSVYATKDLKFITKYSIPERSIEHMPFRFNENVMFVTDDQLIVCTPSSKRTVIKPKRPTGIPLQIGPSYFIVMSTSEISLYEFDSITSTIAIRQVVTRNIVSQHVHDAKDLQWIACKVFDEKLYCLDRVNGLFEFDPANLINLKRVSQRSGCFDFIRPASERGTFLFQCYINGQVMMFSEPPSGNAKPLQHYIHHMYNMPVHPHYLVYVQRSMVTISSRTFPEQVTVLHYNEPLIGLSFEEEQVLIDDKNINKRNSPYKKNITVNISEAKPETLVNQTKAGVFLYVLFRDRIGRFNLDFTLPRLECYSREPAGISTDIKLFNTNNEQKILPLKVSVSAGIIQPPPGKHFLMVALLLTIVVLIVFIGVIYHYEHLENRLNSIYNNLKKKEEKKGYKVEQEAV